MTTFNALGLPALVAPHQASGSIPPRRPATDWAAAPTVLRGRSGLLILAAALAVAGLAGGWAWLGAAAVLPLLYTLPCTLMMAMCMKGHGGSAGNNGPAKPDAASVDSESGPPR